MNEVRTMMHVISHKNVIPAAPLGISRLWFPWNRCWSRKKVKYNQRKRNFKLGLAKHIALNVLLEKDRKKVKIPLTILLIKTLYLKIGWNMYLMKWVFSKLGMNNIIPEDEYKEHIQKYQNWFEDNPWKGNF